jgi:hypothetical protein
VSGWRSVVVRSLVGVGLALVGLSTTFAGERVAEGADSVNDCFGIQKTEKDNGIDFDLSNGCDRSIVCNMQWTVQCESATGKVVAQTQGRAGAMLAAGATSRVFGTADACKAHTAWTIDNVTFACTPVR